MTPVGMTGGRALEKRLSATGAGTAGVDVCHTHAVGSFAGRTPGQWRNVPLVTMATRFFIRMASSHFDVGLR
jgi:hypothetical protein